jgi:uroporphyrinogen decarboxylase
MKPRERFTKAMNHEPTDRVLIDMGKQVGALHKIQYQRLFEYLGKPEWMQNHNKILDKMAQTVVPDEKLLEKFGVDFRWLIPNWTGVKPFNQKGRSGYYDMWGTTFSEMEDYFAITDTPLKEGTLEELEAHPWPDPEDPEMFKGLQEQAKDIFDNSDYVIGADGIKGGILQTCLWLRGYEKFFMDLAMNREYADALMDKVLDLYCQMYTAYFKEIGDYAQLVYITDDLGTQVSLLMSPKMFREQVKPKLKAFNDHLKSITDAKIMFHSDGAIDPLIEDVIEIGVDILNPVQTSTKGLEDTLALKEKYGDRLSFHGAIDVQQIMPKATVEEMKMEVVRRIHDLGSNGGYILAPCHNIGYDIPVENVMALFEAAQEYGGMSQMELKEILNKGSQ